MTPSDLQNQMIVRLRGVLEDFPLKTTYNDPAPFKIYKQNVPEKKVDEYDYSEDNESLNSLYPFAVVKLGPGFKPENDTTQENTIQIIIGVRNEDIDGSGFDDALAVMQAILNDFNSNPLINYQYVLKYPLSWTPTDENTHPFYYIGIETLWESHTTTNMGGMYLERN